MKNKLIDLNNHLFAQLERLGDEDLKVEDIEKEIRRTNAIVAVGEQIIENANLALKGAALVAEYGGNYEKMLPMIEGKATAAEPMPDVVKEIVEARDLRKLNRPTGEAKKK
jgi:hypothetical protein